MKKIDLFFDKLIYFCITLFPALDIITSIMTYNGISVSAGLILKALVLGIVYIFAFFSKDISKFSKSLLIIYTMFIIGSMINNFNFLFPNLNFEYLKLIIKFSYFIVFAIFLTDYLKSKKYDISILKTPIKIILISIVLALITGTSMPSYNNIYKVGVEGWFYSANELGGLLTLLYPISLYLFFHHENSKKIEYIYVIFHAMALLMLGTKVGLLGFLAITIIYFVYRLVFIKKYSYKNGLLITILLLICTFLTWNFLPGVKNTDEKYTNVSSEIVESTEKNNEELVNEMIYSGRHHHLEELKETKNKTDNTSEETNLKKYNYKKIANDYLGYMYMNNGYLMLIERDFHDIIFFFGKIGLILTIFIIAYPILKNIKGIFEKLFDIKIDMLLLSIVMILGIAFISGHTLISPMVSFYIAVVLGLIACESQTKIENDKKKLLFGTVHMQIGGIETSLINLLNKINYDKYDVDLFLLLNSGQNLKSVNENVTIIAPYNKLFGKIINSECFIAKVIKNIIYNRFTAFIFTYNKKYDVAIDYAGYYLFIDRFILNSNSQKKIIWNHTDIIRHYENSKYYQKKYKIHKKKYKGFDKIVCVSDGSKKQFIKMYPENKNKCYVLYNIVSLKKPTNKMKTLKGKYKIVSIGRLTKEKNYNLLIDVHQKLIENGYDVNTYIIGGGEEYSNLKEKINTHNLNKTIQLLGQQTNIADFLGQADLFVSTSLYEAFGIVLLEALNCNVPFIAPKIDGIKDIYQKIAPENSALLVENNLEGVYKGIVAAIKGKVNKSFKFDIDAYNQKNIKDFEQLINK